MNCCNANGDCTQGRDCPIRKQRIKEINDAYTNGYKDAQLDDPYEDIAYTFKGLIAWLGLALGVWIAFLIFWGN